MKYSNIREEELKNRVGADFFAAFDTTEINGNIDFCVKNKQQGLFSNDSQLNNDTPLLRAEAKQGNYDIITMFIQLILTIGKARTFDKTLPPLFLWAFDFKKIAFVEYSQISDIFYQNDFNRNVAPSNHETREFGILKQRVSDILQKHTLIFDYQSEETLLKSFIKDELGKQNTWAKIKINKNNFFPVYLRRITYVKPHIGADRELYKKNKILDTDFFLADLFVEDQNTKSVADDESIKRDLFVIFENWCYKILKENLGENVFFDASIPINNLPQYELFWKSYKRPPLKEYQKYIIERRDLLVPQDIRERKGAYFTPRIRVEKSQEYMADYFGENYQDEYYIRDCAAGTGNLLAWLTNKYNIYASTLDMADVNVMQSMAKNKTINLLESHIFQFDFLNDSFDKLPESLQTIINDPEKRKKLILYINPPYAEATNAKTVTWTGINKTGTSTGNIIHKKYAQELGNARNELFTQFLMRIYKEIPNCKIANFSKLKNLQSANFSEFRKSFLAKLEKIFIVPWDTFDNVKGQFPIGFFIWNSELQEIFSQISSDIYNKNWVFLGQKNLYSHETTPRINKRFVNFKKEWKTQLWIITNYPPDFQNQNKVFIQNKPSKRSWPININENNLTALTTYFSVRHCIEANRLNDRDQFLTPNANRESDSEFQTDCLIFTLFHGQNRITSRDNNGINHRIPFTETQVNAKEKFKSDFMSSYLRNLTLSPEAQKIYNAGLELRKYYHSQHFCTGEYLANASLYEIREYFQWRNEKGKMNTKSTDETYNQLLSNLRTQLKKLANKIAEKVYEYAFLKK